MIKRILKVWLLPHADCALVLALGLMIGLLGPAHAAHAQGTGADGGFVDLTGPVNPELDATPAPSGPKVVGLEIQGNRRIDVDAIRAVLATKPGTILNRDIVAEDVRKVHSLGFFRNVTVVSKDAPEGVIITFVVDENPRIRRVSITGNDNLGAEDITEKLTITVDSTVDRPLITENEARIKALYQSKGFHLVEVSHTLEPLSEGTVALNFEVIEGEELRLREIIFDGNETLDDDDLLKVMQTKPWGWTSIVSQFWDHSGLYAEPVFYQDLDRVTRHYMDEGFIRVQLSEPDVEVSDDGIRVKVRVNEGARYRVGRVEVQGDESMDRDQLLALVGMKPGDTFNRGQLSDDVEALRSFYGDRGFFDARVNPRTKVNNDELIVDCSFEVEKKDLFFVDDIAVHGNTRTRDRVVRRELSIAEGELYSAAAVERSRARVRRLGFFEEVAIEAKRLDNPNRVALDVDVVERPTGSFSFGAGVGSTDGFVLNGSIRQDNLFGQGRGLTASADLGGNNSRFFLRYSEPYAFGTAASLQGTLSQTTREFVDFDETIQGLNFTVSYPLDESETSISTGYSFTGREVEGINGFQSSSLLQREEFQGRSTTSMLTLAVRSDTRDDIRFPKSGRVLGGAIEFAGLGGLNQFLRVEGRATYYMPLEEWLPFESTFVVNTRAGWTIPFNDISDFDLPPCVDLGAGGCATSILPDNQPLSNIDTDLELPLTERYFLGGLGAFQVRGFKQRSLGPRRAILDQLVFAGGAERSFFPSGFDPLIGATGACSPNPVCNSLSDRDIDDFEDLDLTDVIGGNKMFLMNLEMQFPISDELGLSGLVFFDAGNAFGENENINPADLRLGTGAGVQWFSPFGPILVVLGIPLDALEDEDGSVFEFSLGGSQF